MNDARMLETIAACFAPTTTQRWAALTKAGAWAEFTDCAQRALVSDHVLGTNASFAASARREPFLDSLSDAEVRALFAPPSYDEARTFAARHFTGGLPDSAVPVESLYAAWSSDASSFFPGREGLYVSDVALYMADMFAATGFTPQDGLAAYPDHLANELAFAAHLLHADQPGNARMFLLERTEWLTRYRKRLVEIEGDTSFFLALVDLIIGIRACLNPENFQGGTDRANPLGQKAGEAPSSRA